MNTDSVLTRLFSRTTIVFLFVTVMCLLSASFYTYLEDRKLESFSLGAMRMASWNLAQLGNEASAFDREMALMSEGVGDPEEFMLRYDVLWSRYDYLLTGKESLPTRRHQDNKQRLTALFADLKALEPALVGRIDDPDADWLAPAAEWDRQKAGVQQLVIDNFVGDETGQLMVDVEASRARLANLRLLTLAALVVVFLYMALAFLFVRKQSRTDRITGLPNSNYLRSIRKVDPDRMIVVGKIREFGVVFSEYGNEAAIELARLFARKLKAHLGTEDEVIQLGLSEYVLLLAPGRHETAEEMIEKLVAATTFDWRIHESDVPISAVFGVDPPCEGNCPDWNTRYQQAHRALAQAHLKGVSYSINNEDLRRQIEEERQIFTGLRKFLKGEPGPLRLSLVYQPIVSVENRHLVTGAEVLLRCRDDNIGFVPPNRVVDLCEHFGLGVEFGQWLFRQIARETGQLYRDLGYRGTLSINLNPAMLGDHLVADVKNLLIEQGIPASTLCMEITEDNAALEFERINQLIDRLHEQGVIFALDDFGTGHSSLEYVRELKVDRVKIDRCFVDGIELDEDKSRFLGSIIAMADQAYMKSVIEGVENEPQWQKVSELGGSLIQGYHAHRPMPFNDYMALLMDPKTGYPTETSRQLAPFTDY